MATAIEETDVELTDEELAAELDAEIDALIDPHGYMQRAQMAIEPSDPPDPSQDWYAEACFLHSAAENALAAFYALCVAQDLRQDGGTGTGQCGNVHHAARSVERGDAHDAPAELKSSV